MSKKQKKIENKKGKKKQHRVLRKVLKVILIIILFIALFVGGFVGYSVYKNGWGWKGLMQTAMGQSQEDVENLEEFRILILGVSEDISVALTDTIMVASYNPNTQQAVLLSIPRDTFIGDSMTNTSSYDKINAVFQKEGPEGTLEKVNEITGLDIKYYLVISDTALEELVDEIGGVQFDVPIDMDYDSKNLDLHIHLKKGMQTLNGEQAKGLVRFRKSNSGTTYPAEYGGDDYGRMRTQRDFIKAVAKQTLQAKNITKIGNLVDIVKKNVTTNIPDWNTIKDYIPSALEFDLDNLETAAIPGESKKIPANTGLWFFLHDQEETEELVNELFSEKNPEDDTSSSDSSNSNSSDDTTSSKTKSEIKIELLNGSGVSSRLTDATNSLKAQGYTVYKTGTTTSISKTTIVNRSNISRDITEDLKSILGAGVISSNSSSDTADITIILGADYDG